MKSKYINKIFLLGLFILGNAFTSFAQEKVITMYHTNDVHSRIEPIDPNSSDKNAGAAGFVRRATVIEELRNNDSSLLLFDCGDFSQGTPYYNFYRGEVEIKLMNAMKYDAATIGNHEFDFGLENMARLFDMANFPIVCANYDFTGTVVESHVKPYIILNRDGLKIGVFGLSPRLEGLVQASNCIGVEYLDPVQVANEVAHQLKVVEKCDLVVCLSHLGLRPSPLNRASDQVLVKETSNIDVVLGGHSHTFMDEPEFVENKVGIKVPISQMGKNGVFVGKIAVSFDSKK